MQEDKLFSIWEESEKKKDRIKFNRDGMVDEKTYLMTSPKILLILRESYGDVFDLRPYLSGGAHGSSGTMRNASKWIKGITSLYEDNEKSFLETKTEQTLLGWHPFNKLYLPMISVMNLNKQSSTNKVHTDQHYTKYGLENKEFINSQINIYDPTIIICGGTFDAFYHPIYDHYNNKPGFKSRINEEWFAEGYIDNKKRLLINTYHPGARKKQEPWYDSIMDVVKQYKNIM